MFLGERIRFLRIQIGLSQEEVASSIGINRNLLSRIETGKSDPTASVLIKLAEFYNTSVNYIVAPILNDAHNEAKIEYIKDICRTLNDNDLDYVIKFLNAISEYDKKRNYTEVK